MGFGSVVVEKFAFLCLGTDKVITLDPWHVTPLFLYHWRDPSNNFLSNPWSPWSNIMSPTKPFIVAFHPLFLFQLHWLKTPWNGTSPCSYQLPPYLLFTHLFIGIKIQRWPSTFIFDLGKSPLSHHLSSFKAESILNAPLTMLAARDSLCSPSLPQPYLLHLV